MQKVWSALAPFVALLAVTLFFVVAHELAGKPNSFLRFSNIRIAITGSMTVAIAALGMTIIIIAGGIDLSAGTCMLFCSVVLAVTLRDAEGLGSAAVWVALIAAVLTGTLAGAANGVIIGWTRVVPFIATLGTMMIFLGFAEMLSGSQTVKLSKGQVPQWLEYLLSLSEKAPLSSTGFPLGVWLTLVLAIVAHLVLTRTVFGRHVFAIGSNERGAHLAGINIKWHKVAIYAFGGLFIGLASIARFSEQPGDLTGGEGMELQIIAAVVVGGGSLSGGRGSIWGALAGAVMMRVITLGCTQLGISNPVQHMILGGLIITAVAIDQIRNRNLRET